MAGVAVVATGIASLALGALHVSQTQSLNLILLLMALSGRSVTRQTLQGGYR